MKCFLQGSMILLLFFTSLFCIQVKALDSTQGLYVTIDVKPNGDLVITEQFDLIAGGYIFEHGIYRAVPLVLEGQYGSQYLAGFKMLSAHLNDKPTPYLVTFTEGQAIIKVGDPTKKLALGQAKFVISYQLSDKIRFFKNHDELLFHAIPYQWATSIEQSKVVVNLPEKSRALQWLAYTGSYREKGSDYFAQNPKQNEFRFTAKIVLGQSQGMTIVIALPKGVIEQPSLFYLIFLLEFSEWVIAIIFLGAVGSFIYWSWRKFGQYPDGNVELLEVVKIPNELSPALIRGITKHGFSMKCSIEEFTSTCVSLGVKGYLDLKYTQELSTETVVVGRYYSHSLLLTVKPNFPNNALPKNEQCVLEWVINEGGCYVISSNNRKANRQLFKLFSTALKAEAKDAKIFTWNFKYTLITVGLSSMFVGVQSVLGVSDWIDILWGPLVIVMSFPIFILWFAIYESIFDKDKDKEKPASQIKNKALMIGAVWIPWVGLLCYFLPLLSLSSAFLILFCLSAAHLNYAPTHYGRQLLISALQIKKYIEAEKEPEDDFLLDESEYETLLPYAISLELQKVWCSRFDNVQKMKRKQFRKLKARKKRSSSDNLNPFRYKPIWFLGSFSAQSEFVNSLESISYSATGNLGASSSMTSSGFSSGGGFSGGGGGGGGGGGW